MIGLFFTIKSFFNDLMSIGMWLAVGAGIGALATVLRPLWGLLGNAGMGAALMAIVVLGNWLGDDRAYIERLKEQNEILTKKNLELKRTGEAQAELIGELGKASTHNEEVLDRLRDKMDTIPDCEIPEGIIDELRQIR